MTPRRGMLVAAAALALWSTAPAASADDPPTPSTTTSATPTATDTPSTTATATTTASPTATATATASPTATATATATATPTATATVTASDLTVRLNLPPRPYRAGSPLAIEIVATNRASTPTNATFSFWPDCVRSHCDVMVDGFRESAAAPKPQCSALPTEYRCTYFNVPAGASIRYPFTLTFPVSAARSPAELRVWIAVTPDDPVARKNAVSRRIRIAAPLDVLPITGTESGRIAGAGAGALAAGGLLVLAARRKPTRRRRRTTSST